MLGRSRGGTRRGGSVHISRLAHRVWCPRLLSEPRTDAFIAPPPAPLQVLPLAGRPRSPWRSIRWDRPTRTHAGPEPFPRVLKGCGQPHQNPPRSVHWDVGTRVSVTPCRAGSCSVPRFLLVRRACFGNDPRQQMGSGVRLGTTVGPGAASHSGPT